MPRSRWGRVVMLPSTDGRAFGAEDVTILEPLYDRLRALERLLDRDLEVGEHRTELHVALLTLDVLRG